MSKKNFLIAGMAILLSTGSGISAPEEAKAYQHEEAAKFFQQQIDYRVGSYDLNEIIKKLRNKDKDVNTVIVDVRDEGSFQEAHIPFAVNVPDGDLKDLNLVPKESRVIVYCYKVDCFLAAVVCAKWAKDGYKVQELVGGFDDWKKAGNEVEPVQKK